MRRPGRDVEEVAGMEGDELAAGEHFHLAAEAVEELSDFLVLMARDGHAGGAFGEQRDEDAVAVGLISEEGVELVAGNHALAFTGGENERDRALRGSGELRRPRAIDKRG